MFLQTTFYKHQLKFKFDARTSRGSLQTHDAYIVHIWDDANPQIIGRGEASPLKGLSPDYGEDFQINLQKILTAIQSKEIPKNKEEVFDFVQNEVPNTLPSIRFALETALLDLLQGGEGVIFPSSFTKGEKTLIINGLIWMGDKDFMLSQIQEKLKQGFSCVKMKIGAIDFETELSLLSHIRSQFSEEEITLRVDANGAFLPDEAMEKLEKLAEYGLHSIEQPIQPKQWDILSDLCQRTPLAIALDEELIGIVGRAEKEDLLKRIQPQFIILKPTLLGGFIATQEWISLAESLEIDWWITSALEANIGLNAIAQFTATFDNHLPQGLGTGGLYENNLESYLKLEGEKLSFIR